VTRIPGDLDRADTFLWGLTLRQLGLLVPVLVVLGVLAWAGAGRIPIVVLLPVLAALTGGVIALGLVRQDGMAPEALAKALVGFVRRPGRLVWAPEGLPPIPRALRAGRQHLRLEPFREPWRGVRGGDVVVDDGLVRVFAVGALDLQLRSERETCSLTEGFGRLLNALDDAFMVVVRGEPIDVEDRIRDLEHTAIAAEGASMHRATLARSHAALLRSLSGGLRRQVYVVVRGQDLDQLDARSQEVLTLLRPFGISARRLGGDEVVGLLARATGGRVPDRRQAGPGEVVRHAGPKDPREHEEEGDSDEAS
jgi:PrgI family protein